MKTLITLLVMATLSMTTLAQDMSRTEDYDTAYSEQADGSIVYVGKCIAHQDYENNKFKVTSTLVNYFEPRDLSDREYNKKMRKIEKELILEAGHGDVEFLRTADDITIERIKSSETPDLDLYRLNVGVGGGNGMYIILNRSVINGVVNYEFLAEIFDGDVEYCDQKIWK